MADERLVNWIREGLARGNSIQQLRSSLILNGHNPQEVNEAIQSLNPGTKKSGKKIWILIILVGLLILGGVFAFVALNQNNQPNQPVTYNCESKSYFCVSSENSCRSSSGNVLNKTIYLCGAGKACCTVRERGLLKSCSELNGAVCSSGQECSTSLVNSSNGLCCVGTCQIANQGDEDCDNPDGDDGEYYCNNGRIRRCVDGSWEIYRSCDEEDETGNCTSDDVESSRTGLCEINNTSIVVEDDSRSQYLGFSSILNETTQGDAIASFTIASQNAEYILISTKVNWTAYVNGYQGITGDAIFDGVKQLSDSAKYFGLKTYISIDPLEGGDRTKLDQSIPGNDKNFANENVRKSYKNFAKRIATELQPDYLTLGMEVNVYYAANPSDFANSVSLYNETYDLVKQSGMKIGPTFQWDEVKKNSQYAVFDYFKDKSDFFAVTSYPRAYYANVANIPSDYYSSISQYSNNKPIVIGESGWPTNSVQFPSTEQAQTEFLSLLLSETNKLDAELVIWWFMHDWKYPGYSDFFSSSGLLNSNGSAKLSWQVWQDYYMRERK